MDESLAKELRVLFDQDAYLERYPDVHASGMDPLEHYVRFGVDEGRDPNRFFNGGWYREHYPDVAASGLDPLLHYLRIGAQELRNPHPRFDAAWYTEQHAGAAANPLVYHLVFGAQRGWATERPIHIADFLPSADAPPGCPPDVVVDIVIPVYRGLSETRCCLQSVLADPDRPAGRVIVVDDCSPEPELSAFLVGLKTAGRIVLLRNRRNLGFVASVNAGMRAAGDHDVALLNADTEVPAGWLGRLAGHAYAMPRIASVSPFSNNATICSYPSIAGGPRAFGLGVATLDAACRAANGGRRVEVPTTVGFCMYIRRAALNDVGLFDATAFGRGYGEENDFCLRATARGWRHVLACDTFVFHAGQISFGAEAASGLEQGQSALAQRWPNYARIVAQHVRQDDAAPARFAITSALFRSFERPVVLLISHALGGGVQRHVTELVRRAGGRADFLLIESSARGIALSVPRLPGHSVAVLPSERTDDIVALLRSAGVTRVHIHHLMGMDLDVKRVIHALNVPFDLTVHDYYAICPQVNLLPWLDGQYCAEPPPAVCNACIADRPSHGAHDITSWRGQHAWLFAEADRVLCPSEDVRARLDRFGLAERAVVAPHEPVMGGPWPISVPRLGKTQKLRIAVIGVLAQQKGAATVTAVIEAADPVTFDFRLIGHPEHELPTPIRRRIRMTGKYEDRDLPALLARVNPHVVWFPAQWPETYSYTLSAAIEAGLPIVASRIGAFPERLEGRPLTWLVDPVGAAADWLAAFSAVRSALLARAPALAEPRPHRSDFYTDRYVRPRASRTAGLIDLRGTGRKRIVVIPERFGGGALTPCAYIRLIQPFDHLAASAGLDVITASETEALRYQPDIIATHRHAIAGSAVALLAHCREHGIALVYDLDDDLLDVPRGHPEARQLRPLARDVERMLRGASTVWASTPALRQRIARLRDNARVVPNGLDERLWADPPATRLGRQGPVRILFMGTLTHDDDFALVEPALARLHDDFPGRVSFDMIGVSARQKLPDWVNRVPLSISGNLSYPGFVNWLIQQPGWDIGIAPLAGTAFNAAKSAIKVMDYAALGLAVLASNVPAYRGSVNKDSLVFNKETAWYEALSRLVRDPVLRTARAAETRAAFTTRWTLAAQTESRHAALVEAIASKQPRRSTAPAGASTLRRSAIVQPIGGVAAVRAPVLLSAEPVVRRRAR
ncbi:MAG TPA: glycosyltransferase [Acetobacteraceae bacterium]|nr:glycosyltransferase [Acetobacteraceae bacterium]